MLRQVTWLTNLAARVNGVMFDTCECAAQGQVGHSLGMQSFAAIGGVSYRGPPSANCMLCHDKHGQTCTEGAIALQRCSFSHTWHSLLEKHA